VLIGINVFPVVGATYFWFPKMFGRMMDERLGRWNFWTMFLGFNLGFLPMHLTGLLGMPRRIWTYPAGLGWSALNMITTIGSFVFAVGVLLFFVNVAKSLKSGPKALADPWGGPTLEWAVTSPPAPYNFAVIPTVASRHPLWEDALDESKGRSSLTRGMTLDHGKETVTTTPMDAEPDRIVEMPEESWAPLLLTVALGILFVALLLKLWLVIALGGLLVFTALLFWLWPRRRLLEREPARG